MGQSRYAVDVMGFVTRLLPATAEGNGAAGYVLTGREWKENRRWLCKYWSGAKGYDAAGGRC